jgi:cholesterol oxidase
MVGCRENAKNTLDMNYLWFAEKMGLEILPENRVDKIIYKDNIYQVETRKITSFLLKKKKKFTTKGIILAAGTLGTLEILLKQKYKYHTLPLLSDKIGHELRTNAETLCAVSGSGNKMNNGLAITSVFSPDKHTHVEIVKYPDKSNAMKWFFGLSVEGTETRTGRTWKLIKKTFSHPAAFIKTVFDFNWSSRLVILLVMQTVDNAMKMVWENTLFGGKMRIDNTGQKRVPAYIHVGQEVMERYAKKVKGVAQNILLEVFFDRPTTAHILGGCPMSEQAGSGVVDKNLKVHGYPDFYITDGSVIQGNIGVNPALTITSLSEYAMSLIPGKPGTGSQEQSGLINKLNLLQDEWEKKISA